MATIDIEINQDQLRDVRERLAYIENGATRAMVWALNKTGNKARTRASQEIRKQIRQSASDVRAKLKAPNDGWEYKAVASKLYSKVSVRGGSSRLDSYMVGWSPSAAGRPAAPVKVKVKPSGSPITIKSAFFVRAKNSGGFLIAVRNEILSLYGMKRNIRSNLPYQALPAPGVGQVFDDVRYDIMQEMEAFLRLKVEESARRLINMYPPPGDGSDEE